MNINDLNHAPNLEVFSDGFRFGVKPAISKTYDESGSGVKRGCVEGLSAKSIKRLRDYLLEYTVLGATRVAVTYTLPSNVTTDVWYAIIKRWRQRLIRSGVALVWRIELQRRGVPHLHCIAYITSSSQLSDLWLSWFLAGESVDDDGLPMIYHDGWLLYGVAMRYVTSSTWYAYLAAHTAKRKIDQLGWMGRHWGVVNRQRFEHVGGQPYILSDFVLVRLARVIRRRYRYPHFSARSFGKRDFFGMPRIEELISYIQEQEQSSVPLGTQTYVAKN